MSGTHIGQGELADKPPFYLENLPKFSKDAQALLEDPTVPLNEVETKIKKIVSANK
jgi:hypothetical protein